MEGDNPCFSYVPIDTKAKEFRLLVIAPGELSESLDCALIHTSIYEHSSYKALSYTWGQARAFRPINVNGETFMVRRNLENAMRRLRRQDNEVWVWIDAICINQADVTERNQHIVYMHHVYQCAEQVLVWLGEADYSSNNVIDQLRALGGAGDDAQAMETLKLKIKGHSPDTEKLWSSISRVFSRPWWSRVWVMQEIVWAPEILVLCGSKQIAWETLLCAAEEIRRELDSGLPESTVLHLGRSSTVMLLFEYRILRKNSLYITLEHTLTHVRLRTCTDPRDKIYGILNMIPISEWPFLPDYTRETNSIFTDVAKHVLTKSRKLTLLSSCEPASLPHRQDHLRNHNRLTSLPGLPSWVPDWTRPRLTVAFCGGHEHEGPRNIFRNGLPYSAAQDSVADVSFSADSNVLGLKGVCYDVVEQIRGPWARSVNTHFVTQELAAYEDLESWVSKNTSAQRYQEPQKKGEVFWRTLIADRTDHGAKASVEYAQSFINWRTGEGSGNAHDAFLKHIFRTCQSRQVFTTARGLLGLGPLDTRPGDLVCVLLGSSLPMVIRRAHLAYVKKEDYCKVHQHLSDCIIIGCLNSHMLVGAELENLLIGKAYVHGIMEGEVIQALAAGEVVLEDIELR